MLDLIDSRIRSRLVRTVQARFVGASWTVKPTADTKFDLVVEKEGTKFFVACIDGSIFKFRSVEKTIDQLYSDTRHFRSRIGVTLVPIFNANPLGIQIEKVAEAGVPFLLLDEISLVTNLTSLRGTMPNDLDSRQLLLLEGCSSLCVSISDAFKAIGDYPKAIEWAQRSIIATPRVSLGHHRLVELYRKTGDGKAEERVASAALALNPKSTEFIRVMHRLATVRGDEEGAAAWSLKLEAAPEQAHDFNSIVKNQQAKSKALRPVEVELPAQKDNGGFFKKILKIWR